MSKSQTQQKWVIEQLTKHGRVTRNQALAHYISRLSAIIFDLKEVGYEFSVGRCGKENRDYEYVLIKTPKK